MGGANFPRERERERERERGSLETNYKAHKYYIKVSSGAQRPHQVKKKTKNVLIFRGRIRKR